MKIYLVGGAVRDKLLGLPIKERDWVVVGATAKEMLDLGYRQVGKEFPVFLHPKTGEEYALARMERKVKPGYQGFTFDVSPEVTLEEDLIRRDLTINAMAETAEGKLIDPYGGKTDLTNKMLRHVSMAFVEDPVRILRLGRFLARYAGMGFQVAPETMTLMRNMVAGGEVNALVAERVWKELERALAENDPEKFFLVLAECHALALLFPQHTLQNLGIQALKSATAISPDPAIRFAAFMYTEENTDLTYLKSLCDRYRIPNAFRDLAKLTLLHYTKATQPQVLSAAELLRLFSSLDIFRRMDRFKKFLVVIKAIALARQEKINIDWLLACAKIAQGVNVQALITAGYNGQALALKLQEQREISIAAWIKQNPYR